MDELIYLQTCYRDKMIKMLNNQNISYIDREFYAESPNWYTNQDMKSMIDTLVWLKYTDEEKKEILDNDIDEHFM
tara:strand:+ start:421 stop:645 length:225 start_codon:yes stop_codon:yes gene_type:complete